MHKKIYQIVFIAVALVLSGCGTSRIAYDTGHAMSTSTVSGTGRIIGSTTSDADKGLNLVLGTAGKILEGSGKVIGGGIGLAGGLADSAGGLVSGVTEENND